MRDAVVSVAAVELLIFERVLARACALWRARRARPALDLLGLDLVVPGSEDVAQVSTAGLGVAALALGGCAGGGFGTAAVPVLGVDRVARDGRAVLVVVAGRVGQAFCGAATLATAMGAKAARRHD